MTRPLPTFSGEGMLRGFKTTVVAEFGPTFSEHSLILQLLPIVKHEVNIKMTLKIIRVVGIRRHLSLHVRVRHFFLFWIF